MLSGFTSRWIDVPRVGVVQRLGDLRDDADRLGLRQLPLAFDPVAEVLPFDQFVDEIADRAIGSDFESADDVGVFEFSGGAKLRGEPLVQGGVLGEPGVEHLDGDGTAGGVVAGAVDAARAAAADGFTEYVAC